MNQLCAKCKRQSSLVHYTLLNVRAERLDIYRNFGHLLSKFYLHTSDVPIIKWILFIYLFIIYDTFIKLFLPTTRFFFAQIFV